MVVATNLKKKNIRNKEGAINSKLGNSQNNLKAQRAKKKTTLCVNWVTMFVQ